jgi:serine/threonine protein phosphatase 1
MAEIIYAITDTHGRLDLLERAYDMIVNHAVGLPARVVFLGDAIDRGPDSAGCIQRLIRGAGAGNFAPQVNLMGNHEAFMIEALKGDLRMAERWLDNGGDATLRSYGARPSVCAAVDLEIPDAHATWLASLVYAYQTETHIFVHAGVPPDMTLAEALATPEGRHQLIWIRHAFLNADHDFGRHVVHGHSPTGRVDFQSNPPFRTNLDSGAVYGGPLSIGVCMPGVAGRPEVLRVGR